MRQCSRLPERTSPATLYLRTKSRPSCRCSTAAVQGSARAKGRPTDAAQTILERATGPSRTVRLLRTHATTLVWFNPPRPSRYRRIPPALASVCPCDGPHSDDDEGAGKNLRGLQRQTRRRSQVGRPPATAHRIERRSTRATALSRDPPTFEVSPILMTPQFSWKR